MAPYEKRGFDQPMAGAYAVAAGASRALGLDAERTANAVAISGVRQNPLLITRTGELSHWKGFAYAAGCHTGVHSTFLAMRGVTGQLLLMEGPLGVFESVTGEFEVDWSDTSLSKMLEISVKRYNAGLHSQTAIEGVIDMKREHGFASRGGRRRRNRDLRARLLHHGRGQGGCARARAQQGDGGPQPALRARSRHHRRAGACPPSTRRRESARTTCRRC